MNGKRMRGKAHEKTEEKEAWCGGFGFKEG